MRAPAPLGPLAGLGAIALTALALASCGGGSSSTPTTSRAPGGASKPPPKPLPGHPKIGLGPTHKPARERAKGAPYGSFTRASAAAAARRAKGRKAAAMGKLEQKAGKAAPFLVPVGDNSIPTYGSEASASQQGQAEAALRAYLQARAAGNWSVACARLAATVQKQLALLGGGAEGDSKGCAAAYAKLSSRVPAPQRANPLSGPLTSLRAKGEQAFALFYGPHHQQYMMPMLREGGEWKVNQLEALPWPLGS